MKPACRFFHLTVLAVFAVSMLACAPAGPDPEKMIAEAKALDARFVEALNNGDADALAATYWNSPDLVSFPIGGALELKGWQAVRDDAGELMQGMAGATLELTETNYKAAGDVVIGWGIWTMRFPAEDGPPQEIQGRYTDVKAERDGKWVYIMDHASMPQMPPPGEDMVPVE